MRIFCREVTNGELEDTKKTVRFWFNSIVEDYEANNKKAKKLVNAYNTLRKDNGNRRKRLNLIKSLNEWLEDGI